MNYDDEESSSSDSSDMRLLSPRLWIQELEQKWVERRSIVFKRRLKIWEGSKKDKENFNLELISYQLIE